VLVFGKRLLMFFCKLLQQSLLQYMWELLPLWKVINIGLFNSHAVIFNIVCPIYKISYS